MITAASWYDEVGIWGGASVSLFCTAPRFPSCSWDTAGPTGHGARELPSVGQTGKSRGGWNCPHQWRHPPAQGHHQDHGRMATHGGGGCLALVCHGAGTRGGARGLPLGSPLPWAGRGNTHSGGLPRRPGTSLLSPTRWRPQVTVQGRVGLTCPVPRLSPGSRPPRRDKPFPGPFLLPVPSPALSRPPPPFGISRPVPVLPGSAPTALPPAPPFPLPSAPPRTHLGRPLEPTERQEGPVPGSLPDRFPFPRSGHEQRASPPNPRPHSSAPGPAQPGSAPAGPDPQALIWLFSEPGVSPACADPLGLCPVRQRPPDPGDSTRSLSPV